MAPLVRSKLLVSLWLVVAVYASATTTTPSATSPSNTTISPTTTTATSPTTTATSSPTTTTTGSPTTTTRSPPTTNTSAPTTTSTPAPTATATPPPTGTEAPVTQGSSTTSSTTLSPTSTESSNETSPDTPGTAAPVTTQPADPCSSNPCEGGSTCERRAGQNFTCLCLAGQSYNKVQRRCEDAKVFPGYFDLPNEPCTEELRKKDSQQFQDLSQKITKALLPGLHELNGYITSTVFSLCDDASPALRSLRNMGNVNASVQNVFQRNSAVTDQAVLAGVEDAIKKCENDNCVLSGSSFKATDVCVLGACDSQTTTCSSDSGVFSCECRDEYVKNTFSNRVCQACPVGQRAEKGVCINCPYGYSGLNCNESWKLALIVVGSTLGGLLLVTVIGLAIVANRSPKKGFKNKAKNASMIAYNSHSLGPPPSVPKSGSENGRAVYEIAGAPRIPRATANNSLERNTREMAPRSSTQNLAPMNRNSMIYSDPDERGSRNPYQNRSQTNPYTERRGHSNPYYTHDDGRRLN
ncbi:mucin-13-like [Lampris incognitus]|uniref:mucin-13-like n=1 Tax=Lampris incognitus TaxID=2546036 RepID=UPI0024B56BA1|nr:mucin-13-like [Lampris incognitus]